MAVTEYKPLSLGVSHHQALSLAVTEYKIPTQGLEYQGLSLRVQEYIK